MSKRHHDWHVFVSGGRALPVTALHIVGALREAARLREEDPSLGEVFAVVRCDCLVTPKPDVPFTIMAVTHPAAKAENDTRMETK